ncbi:hypothetical protein [Erythrobacter sp. A6_0]|uniref:hypothetical protein n=1 Tax=Erythrobacter sp. A6_0 TaxID=2821089 RepID=UPI001ADBDA9A|nr:hypothetical protein [Erythrobacter sp. A6_0]MBO9510747.1 hypothetical protein [Erythrobacter sp. A6_0]
MTFLGEEFWYIGPMDEEKRALRHQLKNAKQEMLALKGLVKRAADQIDDLAEADCTDDAIENAKAQAERLRKVTSSDSD